MRQGLVKKLRQKLQDQQFKCALTGWPLSVESFEFDHIVPIQDGGTDEISNLIAVHPLVNRAKGTMSYTQFVEMCKAISIHTTPEPPGGGIGS